MGAARKPDFKLKAMDKVRDIKSGKLGAAWLNEDGTINLVLDPTFHMLKHTDDMVYTLFPNDGGPPAKEQPDEPAAHGVLIHRIGH